MIRRAHLLFMLLVLAFVASHPVQASITQATIKQYKQILVPVYDSEHQLKIAIRSYTQRSTRYFLVVDPHTLKTQTLKVKSTQPFIPSGPKATRPSVDETSYIKMLHRYTAPPYKLQNDGASSAAYKKDGVFLTVDLCPSTKKFEQSFFEKLVYLAEKNQRATPVALAISGQWIMDHPKEMSWLKTQAALKKLDIVWVNHSFNHPYRPQLPNERNFLLIDQKKFEEEVIQTEKLLLENNVTPSVFFRFPGLVSNKKLIKKLEKGSLIPIGSNAWLAKGEPILPGSFILVHGNGGEPAGIKIIMPLLSHLKLLPIQEAFIRHDP